MRHKIMIISAAAALLNGCGTDPSANETIPSAEQTKAPVSAQSAPQAKFALPDLSVLGISTDAFSADEPYTAVYSQGELAYDGEAPSETFYAFRNPDDDRLYYDMQGRFRSYQQQPRKTDAAASEQQNALSEDAYKETAYLALAAVIPDFELFTERNAEIQPLSGEKQGAVLYHAFAVRRYTYDVTDNASVVLNSDGSVYSLAAEYADIADPPAVQKALRARAAAYAEERNAPCTQTAVTGKCRCIGGTAYGFYGITCISDGKSRYDAVTVRADKT